MEPAQEGGRERERKKEKIDLVGKKKLGCQHCAGGEEITL